ncbi:MAG: TonB-dependent receptor [Ignavibacteriae bacterium]|nr:MAG: TonB-dependent receptor [Ignavibacteriota bacterium]
MNEQWKLFLIALLVCMAMMSTVVAGTTGKISGTITDAAKGEALISTNIVLSGTSLGATTDLDGNYTIVNIPPGIYSATISMVGYRSLRIDNIKVNVDLTTKLDAQLQEESVQLETMVITAERPLVTKDNTGSLSSVSADQLKNLPVQTISDVLRLDAGIVEARRSLHIRGGRTGEVSYWVDGIATTDVYDGSNGVRVENAAIQELQVISGTFNAEYGQAMSGIVNTITKEGEEKYTGQIKVYGGDYISNDAGFSMYKSVTTEADPAGNTKIVNSQREYPLKKINPIYNAELNLSGPVPLLSAVKFFVMGRHFYDEGYYYGVNWYKPNGAPGDSSIVPMNPNKSTSIQGKLNYHLSNSLKIGYGVFWNKSQQDRNYFNGNITSHDYKYDPYGLPENHSEGLTQTFTLNHLLSQKTFYEFRATRYTSKTEQYKYADPTQKVNYLVKKEDGTTFNPYTPQGQDTLNSIIGRGDAYTYVSDPNGPDGYTDPNSLGQPTTWSFVNHGMDPTHFYRSTSYWAGKFDLTSQLDNIHELKIGAEARLHELVLHSYQVVAKLDAQGNSIVPFEPAIPEEGNLNRNDYVRNPKEISAYIQDKMEFKNIILNLGLRFDYFDANSVVPVDPNDPNIYDPFKNEHIYAHWIPMPASYRGTNDQYIDSLLTNSIIRKYTPDERRAIMQKKASAKMALSPRLGFSFPITDRGIMHFSYGHFSQIPQFQYLYADPDFKVTSSSSISSVVMGNADLEPQKTVMYEIGLQQQFTDVISADVTLFYRDVRGWVGTTPLIDLKRSETQQTGSGYSSYKNKDYENVKGITLKLEKRFSDHFSFRADYTFQSAEGTYSNPDDEYNNIQNNQAPVLALLPLNFDQKHTVNVQFIYGISDWIVSMIGRYWTGLPYTPTPATGSGTVGSSAVSGYTTNSARLPNQKSIDLSISKSFRVLSNVDLQLFLNVYNLLDQRDATSVYSDSGTPDYTTTSQVARPYNNLRVSTVEDFVNQPSWYTSPRQVQVGVSLGFN